MRENEKESPILCLSVVSTDAVSRDYLCDIGPNIMASPLQRACHLIPWSRDDHMMLDDPRWRGLPQCTVPPFKVIAFGVFGMTMYMCVHACVRVCV